MGWFFNAERSPRVLMNNCTITGVDDNDRTQNSFFMIKNSAVQNLYVYGEVHLDDSHVTTFPAQNARAAFVLWHLPIFGTVLVPYSWARYMLPVIITMVITS